MPKGKPKGSPKTGGRQKGTPNKDTSLKSYLRKHSEAYFAPSMTYADIQDENLQKVAYDAYGTDEFSKFDLDLLCCKADDKIQAELTLLKYHTPQMAAVAADMTVKEANTTISMRLERLANGEEIAPDEE
jgi:hypothetical protein